MDQAEKLQSIRNTLTAEGLDKFCKEAGDYVRDVVRATSIPDQILTPEPLTEAEMVPGITETVAIPGVKITEEEDEAWDAVYAWRNKAGKGMTTGDKGRASYFDGGRYAIPLPTLKTETFERKEAELLASNYDLLSIVNDTVLRHTRDEKNRRFLDYCEMAVAASGQSWTVGDPETADDFFFKVKHIDPREGLVIPPATVLLSERAFGKGAYHAKKVLDDVTFIRSGRSSLFDVMDDNDLTQSTMWFFSPPDILGDNLYHGDYKVWAQWEGDVLQFQGWQRAGIGIKDIHGITKVVVTY